MAYIIETFTLFDGWTNTWSDDDGPTTFKTLKDAQSELAYFLKDEEEEFKNGNIVGLSDPEDFRIVEVDDFEGIPEYVEDYFDPEIELDKMYEEYLQDEENKK